MREGKDTKAILAVLLVPLAVLLATVLLSGHAATVFVLAVMAAANLAAAILLVLGLVTPVVAIARLTTVFHLSLLVLVLPLGILAGSLLVVGRTIHQVGSHNDSSLKATVLAATLAEAANCGAAFLISAAIPSAVCAYLFVKKRRSLGSGDSTAAKPE